MPRGELTPKDKMDWREELAARKLSRPDLPKEERRKLSAELNKIRKARGSEIKQTVVARGSKLNKVDGTINKVPRVSSNIIDKRREKALIVPKIASMSDNITPDKMNKALQVSKKRKK